MVKAGLIGLGKMGVSHCSILGAHPDVDLCGVCDTSRFNLIPLEKYSPFKCFSDYREMIDTRKPDCVFIATPTRFHSEAALYAMERGVHLFVEKPLCVDSQEAIELASKAEAAGVVNQVGFHNRFIGTFREGRRLVSEGLLGEVYHFLGEAYGPVALKAKGETWRSKKTEGGGCLYDYASHAIDLIGYYFGEPARVKGTTIKEIFSSSVDDAVYSTLMYGNGLSGQLSINWSEETYRKMTTQITVWGKEGKLIADAQELKIYLKKDFPEYNLQQGWNTRYITDLTEPVQFYLRGEEYSAQVDYFIKRVKQAQPSGNINSFASALVTNKVIDLLLQDSLSEGTGPDRTCRPTKRRRTKSWLRRLLRF
jgi:predicted dehydrogenase